MCFYSAENPLSPGTRMIFETYNGTHAAMEDAVVRSLLFGKPSLFRGRGGFLQSKNTWKRRVCQKTGLIQPLNFWVHPRLMRGSTTDASRVKHVAFVRFRKAIFMKFTHTIEQSPFSIAPMYVAFVRFRKAIFMKFTRIVELWTA